MVEQNPYQRESQHLAARTEMRNGSFHQAIGILVHSIQVNGPHILSLVDLASCYYMVQDYENYSLWTLQAYEQFKNFKNILKPESIQSASLALGKLLEELGQLSLADSLYRDVVQLPVTNRWAAQIKSQLLRLSCFRGDTLEVLRLIASLELAHREDGMCSFDFEHSLLHADLLLHGFETARIRFEEAIKNPSFLFEEKQLMMFDLLYECLKAGRSDTFPIEYLSMSNYHSCGSFEQLLWDILLIERKATPFEPIHQLRYQAQSPLCSLRSLLLIEQRTFELDKSLAIAQKIALILQRLDPKSRQWIWAVWPNLKQKDVEITWRADELTFGARSLSIKHLKTGKIFFRVMSNQTQISTSQMALQLYGMEISESVLGRLRVLVHRINKDLELLCGVDRPVQMNKGEIFFKPGIAIRKVS